MKAKYIVPIVSVAMLLAACGSDAGGSSSGGSNKSSLPSYKWDMTITVGNTSTWYTGAKYFADTMDKKSDGRIKIKVFSNEQLSGGDQVAGVEQLMSGEKEFSYNSSIVYAGIDPKFGAVNAPFLYKDYAQASKTLAATGFDAYKKLAATKGVELLGFGESGFRQITNNVHPITTVGDLKGIKLRIPGIGLFTDIYRSLGANPTTMNFSEVFTALQQKTIDGQENPLDVIDSSGITEVQKYMTIWNYVYDPLIFGMNKKTFDSLDPADQKMVQETAAEANALQIKTNRDKESKQLESMSKKMKVTVLDDAQRAVFQKQMSPIYEKYQSIWGADMAKAVQPQG